MADLSVAAEIRQILAQAKKPITISEVYEKSDLAPNTTFVAATLYFEFQQGRVDRVGVKGSFAYSLSEKGRAALNPDSAKAIEKSAALDSVSKAPPPPAIAKPLTARFESSNETIQVTDLVQVHEQLSAAVVNTKFKPFKTPPGEIDAEVTRESTQRLAAAVICFWPNPLATIPADLSALVKENLGGWHPGR